MKLFKRRGQAPKVSLPSSIDVACAVIRREGKILITRRRAKDHLGGLWEFPGGKRHAGESLGVCLERELWEELGIRIKVARFLKRIDYRYPEKTVSLYFYECVLSEGTPWPHGCQEFRWVRPFELKRYDFPPADEGILNILLAF
jgi:8-oxo-dGTP diphosphatase